MRLDLEHADEPDSKFVSFTVNVLKFRTLFSICSQIKCWFFRAEIQKILGRIANKEDPDQTASSEAV